MAANLDVLLRIGQWFARCDQELRFDDVDAGDQFGDRVFDLHARVHLDEVELVVLIEELERARISIAHFTAGAGTTLAHGLALLCREPRRRRFLDHFLVAALHRAVALAQVHHVAVVVREDLKFDVPRLLQEFFHVNLGITERGECL